MKRETLLIVLAVSFMTLTLNAFQTRNVWAEETFSVEWVNHSVTVLYNGYILVNDTIKIGGEAPGSFVIGLPYQYGFNVLDCMAYPSTNPALRYDVTFDVPLNNQMGFYSVSVSLNPKPENGVFTVVFVLSQSLLRQDAESTSLYTLDFPAFPSLTVKAASCNASLVLPSNAVYVSGSVAQFKYAVNEELQKFAYKPANITFQLTGEDIQLFTVENLWREISISAMKEITVSDTYQVTNQSPKQMTSIDVFLLPNASNVAVEDEFGRKGEAPTLVDKETNRYRVKLAFAKRSMPLETGKSARFTVRYSLPTDINVENMAGDVKLNLSMFENVKYYIKEAKVTFTFPEGAKITGASCTPSTDVTYGTVRGIFQEKFSASKKGTFFIEDFTVEISYSYNLLWLSFRPTLWAWAIAAFGCALIAVWKRPKAPAPAPVTVPTVVVRLTPEKIKSFVDSYEEKNKMISDIKSLETAVGKGRIPRRRYKVQRKTLETRLSMVNKKLEELKLELRSAGGRYADLMRQLEVAETEVSEAEANIRSIESRHKRGDLTLEAYRKLLADYQRRKEKAETAINGILIRLREEVR
ncbi:MAG: hypothetical protein QW717_06190 [Candidatus Bathyarchaeia archaeon]